MIIFCETKRECNFIHDQLNLRQYKGLLHGDIPQEQRELTFRSFKQGAMKCIIATNVAARGLDIPSVDLIIQLQPPSKVDDYVHRSGRTGRAGKKGVCVTFFTSQDAYLMSNIEKMAKIRFRQITEPKQGDIIRTNSKELLDKLRGIDTGVIEYFLDAAKEFISEVGAEKALALALAQINGTTHKEPEISAQTKQQGLVTFVFSSEEESVNEKELFEFLKERVERFSGQDIQNINMLSRHLLAFDCREGLKNKFLEVSTATDQEETTNTVLKYYRLRHMPDEEALRQVVEEQPSANYTPEQYEYATRNAKKLELVVRKLNYSSQESTILSFFRNNGVVILQVKLVRDNEGNSKGAAFILPINEEEKSKALQLTCTTLDGRDVEIEEPYQTNRGSKW